MVSEPGVEGLGRAVGALRQWQDDAAPFQLHPGDLGWFWRFGAEATAAAVRTWSRGGELVAVGLLDGPTLLRLGIAPGLQRDPELARQLITDLGAVLPPGPASVEAPTGALVDERLAEEGWSSDEVWTPLRLELTEPVEEPGVRIEVVGPEQAEVRAAVHRAAFDRSTFTDGSWHAMAGGPAYAEARCLVAHDDGDAVAAVTVWSAGPGRPGLLEPMGVHRDRRGRGHGRAICLAAAAALRDLGSSSATVCTPSANVGGIATYESAGFRRLPERRDRRRDAPGRQPDAAP
ncbi:GNAT family N-acetyltransferase [Petropleomorpha daqingensis]|uniref:Ribosomal protein S18 acetylase RimI-like enzyme n=1 Tax=Petropleomorpha daqingensis TaxID=2026353 RepID=A0A853CGZ9_9ACTN|nr:GNAT family N-acetyltransferase [Petropleomorpha daqingensis]NYJ07234.1 ribosomal protein S18 acetylase RimI-like enzyme [Petropleomorpha daqingensis]